MEELSKEQELFWRKELNALRGPFPEVGLEPPKEETTIEEPEKESIGGIDPDTTGNFSKITMDIYFFMDHETHKYFMMQGQSLTDFGEKTLREAVEIVKKKQKRNKG